MSGAYSTSFRRNDARPVLAAVIVLDQFSRNLFRGAPALTSEGCPAPC
jgi:uncharacterized protein (DUF924 family)